MAILSMQNVTNVFDIPLTAVVADKKFNYRSVMDSDTISDLAISIKKEGQLTPVRVQKRPDGKYDLVFGFRRYAAIKQLAAEKPEEYTTIRAEVEEQTPAVTRKVANITENMAREDLTTYDQAMAFLDLRNTEDMSGTRIANSIGKSISYVNNLMRVAEGLDDEILTRWRAECQPNFGYDKDGKRIPTAHPVCTMDWLTKLVAKTPKAQQSYELQVALGLEDPDEGEEGEEGEGNGPRSVGSPKRATMALLTKALETAEEGFKSAKGEDKSEIKGAISALRFAMGKVKSIRTTSKAVVFSAPKANESDE